MITTSNVNEVLFMEYTVKELAELLDVSKPTVQKVINDNAIKEDKIVKNKYRYYSGQKVLFIIKNIKPDFDFSILMQNTEKPLETTEKSEDPIENTSQNTENTPQTPPNSQNFESFNRMLDIIEQQLKQKDEELAQKNKEIQYLREQNERDRKELLDKLDKAYSKIAEMGQGAQYITAADKTVQIIDKHAQEGAAAAPDIVITPAAETRETIPKEETHLLKKSFLKRLFNL